MTTTTLLNAAVRESPDLIWPCGPCQVRARGICGTVHRADVGRLAAAASIFNAVRGQTLIDEGGRADSVYVIIFGSVKISKILPNGSRQIIGFAHRGGLLGLTPSANYPFAVEAITDLRGCRISRERLSDIMLNRPETARHLLQVALRDLAHAHEHLLLLGRKTALERIATFLLSHAAGVPSRGVQPPRIHLPMSRCDVADYLGVTIETISRSLNTLRRLNVIEVPNVREITLLDRGRLEALANGFWGEADTKLTGTNNSATVRDKAQPTQRDSGQGAHARSTGSQIYENLILIKERSSTARKSRL